jgi:Sec-independent protein translocase protein TatA
MRKFIFTLILLLAGYVGYMYFFGKGEDKANAETIVNETKDLGRAVGDLLRRQKDKYDDGDFDQVIGNVGKALDKLKSSSTKNDSEVRNDLNELKKELKKIDPQKLNDENRKALQKLIDDVDSELKDSE